MVVLTVVSVTVMAVAGLGLAIARSRHATTPNLRKRAHRRHDHLEMGLTLLIVSSAALLLGSSVLALQEVLPDPSPLLIGILIGGVFLLFHAILSSMVVLFRWATRRRLQLNAPRFVLRNAAVTGLVYLVAGLGIVGLATVLPNSSALWVGIPVVVAAFPLFEIAVKPWLLFPKSIEPDHFSHNLDAIKQWVRQTAPLQLGRIRMAVIPGDLVNAFATGTAWTGRWIVLGGGLVRHMNASQLRSVAAHELAHLIRRDVPKLIVLAVVAGVCHVVILKLGVFPLYDAGRYFTASMLGGLSAAFLLGVTPGLITQRIELATDRLGARLTGDPEAACSALVLLASLNRLPIDQGSLTHPPVRKRLEAIRAATK